MYVDIVSIYGRRLEDCFRYTDDKSMVDSKKLSDEDSLMRLKRQGRISRTYERCLDLPVPIVLGALWVTGATLLSASVLTLYLFW